MGGATFARFDSTDRHFPSTQQIDTALQLGGDDLFLSHLVTTKHNSTVLAECDIGQIKKECKCKEHILPGIGKSKVEEPAEGQLVGKKQREDIVLSIKFKGGGRLLTIQGSCGPTYTFKVVVDS